MRILVIYDTKYGSTENFAHLLGDKLHNQIGYLELKNNANKDLNHFDTSIIGGPIYLGQIRKEITPYCEQHLNILCPSLHSLFYPTPLQASYYHLL